MTISGLHQFKIAWADGASPLLSEADHLLRRFGSIEWLTLSAGSADHAYRLRNEADEILIVVSGELQLAIFDARSQSPTRSEEQSISLYRDRGEALLIPFGVAYFLDTQSSAQVLRISTHFHNPPHSTSFPSLEELKAVLNE